MIYVIALRQAARTGDRWQVLPRAYYSVCEALADARRARLRFPLLDFRVARRPTAEKLPDIYRWQRPRGRCHAGPQRKAYSPAPQAFLCAVTRGRIRRPAPPFTFIFWEALS